MVTTCRKALNIPWPGVDSGHLEAVMPGTRVSTLSFRSRAHSVTVCFTFFPSSAVGAAVVEVEPTAVHVGLVGGRRARGPSGSRGGHDATTTADVYLVRLLHAVDRSGSEVPRSARSVSRSVRCAFPLIYFYTKRFNI